MRALRHIDPPGRTVVACVVIDVAGMTAGIKASAALATRVIALAGYCMLRQQSVRQLQQAMRLETELLRLTAAQARRRAPGRTRAEDETGA